MPAPAQFEDVITAFEGLIDTIAGAQQRRSHPLSARHEPGRF